MFVELPFDKGCIHILDVTKTAASYAFCGHVANLEYSTKIVTENVTICHKCLNKTVKLLNSKTIALDALKRVNEISSQVLMNIEQKLTS